MTHSQKIKIPRTKSPVNTNYQKSFTTFSAVFSTIFSIFDYFINLFRLFVYSTQFQVLYFVYFDDCKGSCDLLYYSHNRTANTTAAGKSPPRPLWDRSKASARGKSTGQARRGVQTRRNIENWTARLLWEVIKGAARRRNFYGIGRERRETLIKGQKKTRKPDKGETSAKLCVCFTWNKDKAVSRETSA